MEEGGRDSYRTKLVPLNGLLGLEPRRDMPKGIAVSWLWYIFRVQDGVSTNFSAWGHFTPKAE